MIWLITIVIFLGVLVTVMLVFCFFSQREKILAALRKPKEQRTETRIQTRVWLGLSGPDEPLIHEITFTEEYVPILVPKETLERIRHRVKNGEPLQDFEGLLDFPKRKRSNVAKRSYKR